MYFPMWHISNEFFLDIHICYFVKKKKKINKITNNNNVRSKKKNLNFQICHFHLFPRNSTFFND